MRLVGAAVNSLQIARIGVPARINERHIRIFLCQLEEGVAIAIGAAKNNVVAALDISFGRWFDLRHNLGDFLDKGNVPAEVRIDAQLGFVNSLGPTTIALHIEIKPSRLRIAI